MENVKSAPTVLDAVPEAVQKNRAKLQNQVKPILRLS